MKPLLFINLDVVQNAFEMDNNCEHCRQLVYFGKLFAILYYHRNNNAIIFYRQAVQAVIYLRPFFLGFDIQIALRVMPLLLP